MEFLPRTVGIFFYKITLVELRSTYSLHYISLKPIFQGLIHPLLHKPMMYSLYNQKTLLCSAEYESQMLVNTASQEENKCIIIKFIFSKIHISYDKITTIILVLDIY